MLLELATLRREQCDIAAESGIVDPEVTAVAREQHFNTFPQQ
jgi:hypothetical protein